jgi:hypothetical protein
MTSRERELSRGLLVTPPSGLRAISKEEFLREFPSSVEHGNLALRLLEEACREKSAEDLKCTLLVGFAFGFAVDHVDILCRLVEAEWHFSHEDVVSALGRFHTPNAVGPLFRATQRVPEYLNFDDSRALAVKAIWAPGRIPGSEAETKLELLTHSENAILRENASKQLARRHKTA